MLSRRIVPGLLSRSSIRVALALSLAARASTSYAFVFLPSARVTAKRASTLVSRSDRFLVETSHRRSKSSLGSMSAAGPPGDVGSVEAMKFTVAACQILCGEDKAANIASAEKAVRDAAAAGAQVVVLPECWNSPYDTASFPVYAEPVPEPGKAEGPPCAKESPSSSMLCRVASENKVFVVGGSVPEVEFKDGGGIYNTCIVVDPDGRIVAKHRKVHLFDIDVPGGIRFRESDTLSPGNGITTVETPYGVIGVAICYDMRFPELSIAMRDSGAVLLCYPGAFNMTTGPAHWELLQRARAVDNQCYVVTASPARNPNSKYQAWGHSSVVDPWGTVVAATEHESATVIAEVDIGKVSEIRRSVPVSIQKRTDLYKLQVF